MKAKTQLFFGVGVLVLFVVWTVLVCTVGVQPLGLNGTNIGFAVVNCKVHSFFGVNMLIYHVTDWLGLVPLFCCFVFGVVGLVQTIKRKSVLKVDLDIILLGFYYILVIVFYLVFETISINYRPILINGVMEKSYPSSTTLLTLCVMPTVVFQVERRIKNSRIARIISICIMIFSAFMVVGRSISGVHWITDIIGAILFSAGLYLVYRSIVLLIDNKRGLINGI